MEIVIQNPLQASRQTQIITLEQYQKKRELRRRRVAKRQYKRFPLFAVEFMRDEFPDYDYDTFVYDVTKKSKKGKSFRRPKSPLKLQGRYPMYEKALFNYNETKDIKYLQEAQSIRNRLFKPYYIEVVIGDITNNEVTTQVWKFPSTIGYKAINELFAKVKKHGRFKDEAEVNDFYKENTQYLSMS